MVWDSSGKVWAPQHYRTPSVLRTAKWTRRSSFLPLTARMCLSYDPPILPSDTHLAIHQDVKANPKHFEEVAVVGSILHEVPGEPWARGGVGLEEEAENHPGPGLVSLWGAGAHGVPSRAPPPGTLDPALPQPGEPRGD